MSAYYSEHDPFAAAWLRELIADGLIAPGEVDERDIQDVTPNELRPFRQCHFFAGIGVWSLALRQAGWPDNEPIWTGSCPCQPFSAAGKGVGFADERHLWPAFHWLIEQCRPELVLGEQVASNDGLAWLDLVSSDLEATDYAFGAVDTCAAGFGAPHIRQRLYWMADANDTGLEGRGAQSQRALERSAWQAGVAHGLANAGCERSAGWRDTGNLGGAQAADEGSRRQRQRLWNADHDCRADDGLEQPDSRGTGAKPGSDCEAGEEAPGNLRAKDSAHLPLRTGIVGGERPGPLNGLWRAADWIFGTDGKWRPVAPGTFPLAPVGAVRNRVGQLRGAGNAINVAQAQGFIEAVMDARFQAERLAA